MKKIAVLLVILMTLTACRGNGGGRAENLTAAVSRSESAPGNMDGALENGAASGITGFSLRLLDRINRGENTLISPLSIVCALGMTANGAKNETLSQMEEACGTDIGNLNEFLCAYGASLPAGDTCRVSLCNSIWIRDRKTLTVREEFLQTASDYYNAEIFKASFDKTTKKEINSWVNDRTGGQIKELLSEPPDEQAVMYLINALSFDAEWQRTFADSSVREDVFFTEYGAKKMVPFLHSEEYGYIQRTNFTGFSKPYAGGQYSFVALLPAEGLTAVELVGALDGGTLLDAVRTASDEKVIVSFPKFSFEYGIELSEPLGQLGVRDAFDGEAADFSALGLSENGNIYISGAIHKTKIAVDEKGTEAGAAAVSAASASGVDSTEPRRMNLNRPFFFMIVDNAVGLPLLMGVLSDPA